MRALVALVAWAASLGCGDDDPPSPSDLDGGLDGATDASLDASPPVDAATDAPSDVPGDTCTNPIDIRASFEPAEDGAYHISGNLDDYADDLDACGLPSFDGDAVYVFVPPADGQIRTTMDDSSWADLALRSTCDDPKSQLSCIGYPGFGCPAEPCGHVEWPRT